ncbi:Hypothetical Protein FCC1311_118012, partial [Hondaea fermentalgiana]
HRCIVVNDNDLDQCATRAECTVPDGFTVGPNGDLVDLDACEGDPCSSDSFCTDLPPPAGSEGFFCTPYTAVVAGQELAEPLDPRADAVIKNCANGTYQPETFFAPNRNAAVVKCRPHSRTSCNEGEALVTLPTTTSDGACHACADGTTPQIKDCDPLGCVCEIIPLPEVRYLEFHGASFSEDLHRSPEFANWIARHVNVVTGVPKDSVVVLSSVGGNGVFVRYRITTSLLVNPGSAEVENRVMASIQSEL